MPSPSEPITIAVGPLRSASYSDLPVPSSVPTSQIAAILELAQRARKIDDSDERHGLGGARRDLAHDRRHAGRPVARHDHGRNARCVGRPQARAKVVRVLDTVEHEQQRRIPRRLERFLELGLRIGRTRHDFRDHALVAPARGHAIQRGLVGTGELHSRLAARVP